jgi:hypothetical protein
MSETGISDCGFFWQKRGEDKVDVIFEISKNNNVLEDELAIKLSGHKLVNRYFSIKLIPSPQANQISISSIAIRIINRYPLEIIRTI